MFFYFIFLVFLKNIIGGNGQYNPNYNRNVLVSIRLLQIVFISGGMSSLDFVTQEEMDKR